MFLVLGLDLRSFCLEDKEWDHEKGSPLSQTQTWCSPVSKRATTTDYYFKRLVVALRTYLTTLLFISAKVVS